MQNSICKVIFGKNVAGAGVNYLGRSDHHSAFIGFKDYRFVQGRVGNIILSGFLGVFIRVNYLYVKVVGIVLVFIQHIQRVSFGLILIIGRQEETEHCNIRVHFGQDIFSLRAKGELRKSRQIELMINSDADCIYEDDNPYKNNDHHACAGAEFTALAAHRTFDPAEIDNRGSAYQDEAETDKNISNHFDFRQD